MSDVYALLDSEGRLHVATRRGDRWQVVARIPDAGAGGRRMTVFVDGRDVLTRRVSLPARTEAEARRAAPFAIEDELAVPVEQAHVVISPALPDQSGIRQVSAVSHERMVSWIETLSALGVPNAQILPIHAVLPPADQLFACGEVIMGSIEDRYFTLDSEMSRDVIASLIGHNEVAIHGERLEGLGGDVPAGPGFADPESLLIQLSDWATDQHPAELRQGAFGIRRQVGLTGLSQWRRAAVLAGVLGAGWLVSVLLELNGLRQRLDMLEAKTAEFATAGWPEVAGDIDRVMADLDQAGTMTAAGDGPSPLTLIAILYEGLDQVADAELKSVRYDGGQSRLLARVGFDDFVGIDALSRALQRDGLSVSSGDARQSGTQVVGEIELGAVR